jgi:uncharacterized protein (TIRG00374 family)
MKSRVKKTALLSAKILLAVVLLWTVLRQVHWHDYVVHRQSGQSATVLRSEGPLDAPIAFVVTTGPAWNHTQATWPIDDIQPAGDDTDDAHWIRPGFKTSLVELDARLAIAAVAMYMLSLGVMAFRWRFLLAIQGLHITLFRACQLTLLGMFFNNVVPGTIGGDLVKAWYVGKRYNAPAGALLSVALDRIIGLLQLTMIATVMLVIALGTGLESAAHLRLAIIAVACALAGLLLAGAVLLVSPIRRALHLGKLIHKLPMAHHILAARDALACYRRSPLKLLAALGIASTGQMCFVVSMGLIGASLGLATPWYSYLLYIPLIYVIGSVPVTPGGIGFIEKLFLIFFAVNPSGVLVLALLARLIPMLISLTGLGVFLAGPHPHQADIQHDMLEDD